MKRVCAVVCSNGFGHFRRTVQVASALLSRVDQLHLNIVCSSWQLESLARWTILQTLRENPQVTFQFLEAYPRWSWQRDYYGNDRLLTWHELLEPVGLDAYDLVLSDNLVEPLIYHPCTVLMGSFLWHDVYAAHLPNELVVQKYWSQCVSLLQRQKPPMIVNRYFAMPAVREQTRPVRVGMIPSVVSCSSRQDDDDPGILFVGSLSSPVAEVIQSFLRDLLAAKSLPSHSRLFVDRRLAEQLPISSDVTVFDYDVDDFNRIDAVVARPGMGTITDCVATGTPLFCFYEPNPEMEHNAQTLERLGLGWRLRSLRGCLDQIGSFFADPKARRQFQNSVGSIDRHGLEQTVEGLMSYLE